MFPAVQNTIRLLFPSLRLSSLLSLFICSSVSFFLHLCVVAVFAVPSKKNKKQRNIAWCTRLVRKERQKDRLNVKALVSAGKRQSASGKEKRAQLSLRSCYP